MNADPAPLEADARTARLIARAALRRCPRCGSGRAWFVGWFRQADRCVGCGLRRTRNTSGHELGSLTVALVLNITLVVVAMAVAISLTVPDVPVLTLYVVLASTSILVPILTWPMTHTLWMALDLALRPMDARERAEAAAWVARRSDSADNA